MVLEKEKTIKNRCKKINYEGGIKMAQPKRRWSKARTHSKRSTWKKEQPKFASCPHCHEPILPHRVCSNCGYYDGKEVVAKKETENA